MTGTYVVEADAPGASGDGEIGSIGDPTMLDDAAVESLTCLIESQDRNPSCRDPIVDTMVRAQPCASTCPRRGPACHRRPPHFLGALRGREEDTPGSLP